MDKTQIRNTIDKCNGHITLLGIAVWLMGMADYLRYIPYVIAKTLGVFLVAVLAVCWLRSYDRLKRAVMENPQCGYMIGTKKKYTLLTILVICVYIAATAITWLIPIYPIWHKATFSALALILVMRCCRRFRICPIKENKSPTKEANYGKET